jgi:hypothetical protein
MDRVGFEPTTSVKATLLILSISSYYIHTQLLKIDCNDVRRKKEASASLTSQCFSIKRRTWLKVKEPNLHHRFSNQGEQIRRHNILLEQQRLITS